ncbi:MAG: ATP-binding protein [Phycisphaerae bacterium]|nr:ATP-binding protein [Phycisphaerae bacterium]
MAQIPSDTDSLIPFGSLNVLIGPNGAGKSSLLQAIDFLRAFFMSSVEVYLRDHNWDYKDLPNLRRTQRDIRWELTARLDSDENGHGAGEYRYVVSLQPRKHLGVGEEILEWTPPSGQTCQLLNRKGRTFSLFDKETNQHKSMEAIGLPASIMSQLDSKKDIAKYPEMLRFRNWIEKFRAYLIWDPKILRTPDRGEYEQIGLSGEHLAAVMGRLKDKHPDKFKKLVERIRGLFPSVTNISVAGRGWGWRTIQLHEGNGREIVFNSQQMSDGVLRLLAITTFLYLDRIPSLITLEEPENGVHPQLVRKVVQILRELTQRKSPNKCQVFFTTHSPYVLDEFFDHPEEVYCMDRPKPLAGASIIRLSDNRQIDSARRDFDGSLGEAWTIGLLGATAGVGRR